MSAQTNGNVTPSHAKEEELYSQLLGLRDAVIAGKHPLFKLSPAVIEQLKANLSVPVVKDSSAGPSGPSASSLTNGVAFNTNAVFTNNAKHSQLPVSTVAASIGSKIPATVSTSIKPPTVHKPISSGGLDPIFLEKSDSLVRAEGQLKRQRIERDLQAQLEQRKNGMDKFAGADASPLDVEGILAAAFAREQHVSGLKSAKSTSPASSFDTNDYYSSQVESDWSSPSSASEVSDHAADAIPTDIEHVHHSNAPPLSTKSSTNPTSFTRDPATRTAKHFTGQAKYPQTGDYLTVEDEDDEYTPPDAATFDSPRKNNPRNALQPTPPEDDDNSDYEPGEITQERSTANVQSRPQYAQQHSPRVPIIRNHLTHIAAPQPNRVSPLAVAKHPSIELELVNGRPELVQRSHQTQHAIHSRGSTVSPANGFGGSNKKRKPKKRKRDLEPSGRGKRKRERQNAGHSPTSPTHQEPQVKAEPVSPPSHAHISDVQPYAQRALQYSFQPAEVDLVSPRHAQPHVVHAPEPPRSALRYGVAAPSSPAVVRVASPAPYRPVYRDDQDLRRVASLHNIQRPISPPRSIYSPASHQMPPPAMNIGARPQPTLNMVESSFARYQERPGDNVQYVRSQQSPSPPLMQQYRDPYGRMQSPALMAAPAAPQRRIVVDQYGNQYYAAEPVPPPALARASMVPVERRAFTDPGYERAASRVGMSYDYPPLAPTPHRQPELRMAPPPVPIRQADESMPVQHIDMNGHYVRDYDMQPAEPRRYLAAPTSPTYQAGPRQEQLPSPSVQLAREQTAPSYAPTRSYSVRPDEYPQQQPLVYAPRQGSVASVQYVRQEVPPAQGRMMSVAPTYEQQTTAHPRAYSQVPQTVQYVDQYGRPVYPSEVRQVLDTRYRNQ